MIYLSDLKKSIKCLRTTSGFTQAGYIFIENNQVIRLCKYVIYCYLGGFVRKSGKNQV